MADPNTPQNQPAPPEGPKPEKLEEHRKTVKDVRQALDALRKTLPEKASAQQESSEEVEKRAQALGGLLESLRKMRASQPGTPEWRALESRLTKELTAQDAEALVKALNDINDQESDREKELAFLAKDIDDELTGVDEYIERFRSQPEQRLVDKVDSLVKTVYEKLPPFVKDWFTAEDIRNVILSLIAGIIESFPFSPPALREAAAGIRYRIALQEAENDKRLTPEHRRRLAEETQKVKQEWMRAYKDHLLKKGSKQITADTPPPSIYDVLNPAPVVAPTPEKPPENLFGVEGLKLNTEKVVTEPLRINYNEKKLILSQGTIKIEGKKLYRIRATGKDTEPTKTVLTAPNATDSAAVQISFTIEGTTYTATLKQLTDAMEANEGTATPKEKTEIPNAKISLMLDKS
jgi:hypothetical protein